MLQQLLGKREMNNVEEDTSLEMKQIFSLINRITLKGQAIERLSNRLKEQQYEALSISSLLDKQSQAHVDFNEAQNNHADVCVLTPPECHEKIPFFKDNYWKGICFTFDSLDEFIMKKLDLLYKSRDAEQQARDRETSIRVATNSPDGDHSMSVEHYKPLKLPQLHLVQFSGALDEWQNFHDQFNAAVHMHPALAPIEKMQHLKGALKGEAAKLISNLKLSDANYPVAWDALCERYERKPILVNSYLLKIYNIPNVPHNDMEKLHHMRDTLKLSLDALEQLGRHEAGGDMAVLLMTMKLSNHLQFEWRKTRSTSTECPTMKDFIHFLDEQVNIADLDIKRPAPREDSKPMGKSKSSLATTNQRVTKCTFCQDNHFIAACSKFQGLDMKAKQKFRTEQKLCVNCLSKGHPLPDCRSKYSCRKCGKRHHTLLHFDTKPSNQTKPKELNEKIDEGESSEESIVHLCAPIASKVMIATALVQVRAPSGRTATVRALIDSGSEISFISSSLAQTLQLKRIPVDLHINGLQGVQLNSPKFVTAFSFTSARSISPTYNLAAYILQSITSYKPKRFIPALHTELHNITLADPEPDKLIRIELLLGADVIGQFMKEGLIRLSNSRVTAQATTLGWILQGPVDATPRRTVTVSHVATDNQQLLDAVEKF